MTPSEKQAETSLGDTIASYFKDNKAITGLKDYYDKTDFTPGMLGAGVGAGALGLTSIGKRPGENPRQRALRVLRNAAAGGLLGGVGTQALSQGFGTVVDNMIDPEAAAAAASPEGAAAAAAAKKPGVLSSPLARAVYGTSALVSGRVWQAKRRLENLGKLMPAKGLGHVPMALHADEASGRPGRSRMLDLSSASPAELEKKLINLRDTYPKSFPALLDQIDNLRNNNRSHEIHKELKNFLHDAYSRGTGKKWFPGWNKGQGVLKAWNPGPRLLNPGSGTAFSNQSILRRLNFMGSSGPTRLRRIGGGALSVPAAVAAVYAPEMAGGLWNRVSDATGRAAADYAKHPLPGVATPPPPPTSERSLLEKLLTGYKAF